jgi:3-carboxy-cis,cis-muconate cycloisomerase
MTPRARTLFDQAFASEGMLDVFCDHARLQRLLDFEAALAKAEGELGVIPSRVAIPIASYCNAGRFDFARLAREAALAGNVAIPLVAALRDSLAHDDAEAALFVHFGATSQDAIDTGLVLQLRDALDLLDADLKRLGDALAGLVTAHQRTVLLGRTWLQPALPVTFALKAAGWLSALGRNRERLRQTRERVLVIQFGGAAGTLASLGERGLDVGRLLARELKLALPDLAWHTQRDRVVEVATTLAILVGGLGKMARDIALMMQFEVAEAWEPRAVGRGGSSTLPHKQNPVGAAAMLAAATRVPGLVATLLAAMPQEHERGLGGWQAEWESLPEICLLSSGALRHAIHVIEGLSLDTDRMRANLEAARGVTAAESMSLALAPLLGRAAAHSLVEAACRAAIDQRSSLLAVLSEEPEVASRFSRSELARLCDPTAYLGLAEELSSRALAEYARISGRSAG